MSHEELIQLDTLPDTLELLQEEIDGMVNELGGEGFRAMGDAAGKCNLFPLITRFSHHSHRFFVFLLLQLQKHAL